MMHAEQTELRAARVAPERTDFRPVLLRAPMAGFSPERKMKSYFEKLRDPRWQRRRLEIMHRAHFACESCGSGTKTLNVHHKLYRKGADPWDYADHELACVCEDCHGAHHEQRDAINELFGEMELFQLPYAHALLVGYMGGIVRQEGVSDDEVTHTLFDGSTYFNIYRVGMLASSLEDAPVEVFSDLEYIFSMIDPDHIEDFIKRVARQAWEENRANKGNPVK